MTHPLETYLRDVRQIHGSGAAMAEVSYYNALGNLLDAAGSTLNPKVRSILQLKNVGAGIPDGGLFTQDQIRKAPDDAPLLTLLPSRGAIEVKSPAEEIGAIVAGAEALRLEAEEILGRLGATTCDVWLNERVYWRNVPERVWEYTIGGYQVIKKWLSYREAPLLGRALTNDEAREVQAIARRIAAILLLEPALDANYRAVTAATYPWPAKAGER